MSLFRLRTLLLLLLPTLQPLNASAQVPVGGPASGASTPIGERWAVVIGISEYEDPEIPDLSFAHRDAQAFAEFLISPRAGRGGFRMDHIRLLTDQDATANQIRTALFDFLQRPGPDDIVYLFFAGHGMPAPGRPGSTQYLIPSDGDQTNFAGSAIRMADVESAVRETRARVVLFVDACHSGAIGTGTGTRGDELNRINEEFLNRIGDARPSGVSLIVAAHEGEYAQEDVRWGGGHGVFTFHMLQALQGRGDRDGDGIVDLGELFDYTRIRVAEDTDNQQTPYANARLDRVLPVAIVGDEVDAAVLAQPQQTTTQDAPLDVFEPLDLIQQDWFAPDSITSFVGVADTVQVLLGSPRGRRAPPSRLRWESSNPEVATIDGFGTLTPRRPGVTEITASVFTKDAQILVRVLPPPESIAFTPAPEVVELSQFDNVRFSAVVELPGGQTLTGVLPTLTLADTSVLAPDGNGRFRALREGSATVQATLGTASQTYRVDVRPPRVRIDRGNYGAVRFADTIPLEASFVREDGSRITEATGVTWETSDSTILRATSRGLVAVDVGRATIRASVSASVDSLEVFVLGDLLVTTAVDGGHQVSTIDLSNRRVELLVDDDSEIRGARLSPDGRRVVFSASREDSGRPRIHVMDADGTNVRRLTPDRGAILSLPTGLYQEHSPSWSTDGERVYFLANYSGNYEVYSVAEDGSDLRRVTDSGSQERAVASSPEGGRIAYERATGANASEVWVALPDGDDESLLIRGEGIRGKPVFLPGGTVLASETGRDFRAGEGLSLFDAITGQKVRTLVTPDKDRSLLFAASPSGELVAYAQVPRLGSGDPIVVVIDLEGTVIDSFPLPDDQKILDLSWGAMAPMAMVADEGGA